MIKDMAINLNVKEDELLKRADGRIEWVCPHGVGHTVYVPKGNTSIHGCDGCCKGLKVVEGL
jgi:hypothetical protein